MADSDTQQALALVAVDGIRDADLLASLDKARGSSMFDVLKRMYQAMQQERDQKATAALEKAKRLALMPRDRRRRAVIREVIENEPTGIENLRYMHSVMAVCALPYRKLEEGRRD